LLQQNHLFGDGMALHMAELTLKKMAYGGLYDQLGGGFARYSTDNEWLVPHFEKMLYDNALLSRVYLLAYRATGNVLYRRIVEETLDFVVREMRHDSGGFYSSYDADSEGVEGKFYVWQADEIRMLLGEDAELFMRYYDVSEQGNWEGASILNMRSEPYEVAEAFNLTLSQLQERIAKAKKKLYDVRAKRIWPSLDDKILTAWNGLMQASFAEAGRFLDREDYLEVAAQNAQFLYETMRLENGRLLRTWKDGNAPKYNGYLEDYAYLADGLLALYQATFDEKWFIWAQELADLILTYFVDDENGGFFDTSIDHEALLNRPKSVQDNATPSGNSVAAGVMFTLGLLTAQSRYLNTAESMIMALEQLMSQYPNAFGHWLSTAVFMASSPKEVAIVVESDIADSKQLLTLMNRQFHPNLVVAVGKNGENVPLLDKRSLVNNQPTAYVCEKFICKKPVTSGHDLLDLLS
ncbi:MAG: thioredoxin domain-containing protein, partial [Chloroflexota bacterium]